jgi:hypothetical protein
VTVAYVGVREVSPGTLFLVYARSDEPHAFNYAQTKFDTVGRTVGVKKNSVRVAWWWVRGGFSVDGQMKKVTLRLQRAPGVLCDTPMFHANVDRGRPAAVPEGGALSLKGWQP